MFRIGYGFDSHKLEPGTGIVLGGVVIPCEKSVLAHSDGDVVLHALTDAVLGAAAAGDIGDHFPDTDPVWKDAESSLFLERAIKTAAGKGLAPVNCDITVIAPYPRLSSWKEKIRVGISDMLEIPVDRVSVKATTGKEQPSPTAAKESR